MPPLSFTLEPCTATAPALLLLVAFLEENILLLFSSHLHPLSLSLSRSPELSLADWIGDSSTKNRVRSFASRATRRRPSSCCPCAGTCCWSI
jgi:hypothetical protein